MTTIVDGLETTGEPPESPAYDETTTGRVGRIGAKDAAARLLAGLAQARLRGLVAGGKAADRPFALAAVYDTFPAAVPADLWKTPSLSITEIDVTDEDYDPEAHDATADLETDTALQSTESEGMFSVDLWASDPEERKALEAAFRGMFAGRGSVAGRQVWLRMPAEAMPPGWEEFAGDFFVRLMLDEGPRRVDEERAALSQEWRSTAKVSWQAHVITVTDVARLDAIMHSADVVDPGTFEAEAADVDSDP